MYIHTKSNHPPIITKQLPRMISHRLSMLSSTEAIFNEECRPYKEALAKSEYKEDLKYTPPQPKSKNTRHRKILWFNPPFNLDVKANVAAKFLKMVDKNFPKDSELYKFFNRSTIKVSYSTMPNMKACLDRHNRNILCTEPENKNKKDCNCRKKDLPCPLEGKCLQSSVVYQADVNNNDTNPTPAAPRMTYYGLTSNAFKTRYNQHKVDFRDPKKRGSTKLSNHIWELKEKNVPHEVKWSVKAKAMTYKPGAR